MEMNFIKVTNPHTGKAVGFAVVEKGSLEEVMVVDKFIDAGFDFKASNESEFNSFDGDFVKKFGNGMFCTEAPMAD
jgi:hypothetical protein